VSVEAMNRLENSLASSMSPGGESRCLCAEAFSLDGTSLELFAALLRDKTSEQSDNQMV